MRINRHIYPFVKVVFRNAQLICFFQIMLEIKIFCYSDVILRYKITKNAPDRRLAPTARFG